MNSKSLDQGPAPSGLSAIVEWMNSWMNGLARRVTSPGDTETQSCCWRVYARYFVRGHSRSALTSAGEPGLIKHVGKVSPGDPYFCLPLPCHTRLPLRGSVGIGGAEAFNWWRVSWDLESQPVSVLSRISGPQLLGAGEPLLSGRHLTGINKPRYRDGHEAICSAPSGTSRFSKARGSMPAWATAENAEGLFSAAWPATWSQKGNPRRQSGLRRCLALESGSFLTEQGQQHGWGDCGVGHPSFTTASATPRGLRGPGSETPALPLSLHGRRGQRSLLCIHVFSLRLFWESPAARAEDACMKALFLFLLPGAPFLV